MKQMRVLKTWGLRLALLIVFLGGLSIQAGYASSGPKKDQIDIRGEWEDRVRAIDDKTPVTAFTDGGFLYIQSATQNADISIDIIDENGEVVWQGNVPAVETENIAISIADLPTGIYTLELQNGYGGYLCGSFTK